MLASAVVACLFHFNFIFDFGDGVRIIVRLLLVSRCLAATTHLIISEQRKLGRNVNVHICWAGTLLRPANPQGVWSLTCGPARLIRLVTRLAIQKSRGSCRNYESTRGTSLKKYPALLHLSRTIRSYGSGRPQPGGGQLTCGAGRPLRWCRISLPRFSPATGGDTRRPPPAAERRRAATKAGPACATTRAIWCVLLLPVLLSPFFRFY